MSTYRLQLYSPDQRSQVCELQTFLWGTIPKLTDAYHEWKHLRNPYFEEPLIYVALHGDRVVGKRAMFGTCWQTGGEGEKAVLPSAADTAIHPDYRDQGLFNELTGFVMEDLRQRGHSHVLNLSSSPANYVVSVMTMGWRPLGSSEPMLRESPSDSTHSNALVEGGQHPYAQKIARVGDRVNNKLKAAAGIHAFSRLDRYGNWSDNRVTFSEKVPSQRMAALVDELDSDGRLQHVRDEAYFSWRYANPCARYRFLLWGGTDPDGYMVLQNIIGREQVNIVDWEGRNSQIRADLLKAAVESGQFRTMGVWGASLSRSSRDLLEKAGFVHQTYAAGSPDQYDGRFLIKWLGSDASEKSILGLDPFAQKNWNLRRSDSDGE